MSDLEFNPTFQILMGLLFVVQTLLFLAVSFIFSPLFIVAAVFNGYNAAVRFVQARSLKEMEEEELEEEEEEESTEETEDADPQQ